MEKCELVCIDFHRIQNALTTHHTKEALLLYFQEVNLHPNSKKEDGGHFQLYFYLKQTGFHIKQCLSVDEAGVECRTTIAEISVSNPKQAQPLRSLLAQINSEIEYGRFYLDMHDTGSVQFRDRFCPEALLGDEILLYFFENFERLIGYPQFLINREYGTEFLQFKESS